MKEITTPKEPTSIAAWRRFPLAGWRFAIKDAQALLQADFRGKYPQPLLALVCFMLPAFAAWWLYVPVHEFLHAVGCWVGGGVVTQLDIDTMYGGALFARIFPFVKAGSAYAGQLSGFDPGSDLGYLLTDFAPFLLSVLFGVSLLRRALSRNNLLLLGPGLILAFAPFMNLLGDYYEMGSIITTRACFALAPHDWKSLAKLRSDDFIKLVSHFSSNPAVASHGWTSAVLATAGGAMLSLLLAGFTYQASVGAAWLWVRIGSKSRH